MKPSRTINNKRKMLGISYESCIFISIVWMIVTFMSDHMFYGTFLALLLYVVFIFLESCMPKGFLFDLLRYPFLKRRYYHVRKIYKKRM